MVIFYQYPITFGTTIQGGDNVTVTGSGSNTDPYMINATGGTTNITQTNTADTTTNLDFLTDATTASGSTISGKYKTLAQGTNITLNQSGSTVTINANNITLTPSADTTSNTDVLTDATTASGSTITAKYKTLVGSGNTTVTSSGS